MRISSESGSRRWLGIAACGAAFSLATMSPYAHGQALQRAAFVGNNGNLEGSVSSFIFSPEGMPQRVQYLVLGSGSSNLANNVYAITLSPDGRHLATTHATGFTPRLVHILRINSDATMTVLGSWPTPPSPLDAVWINNDHLAVTLTNSSGSNRVIIYRFDESTPALTEIGRWDTGTFNGYLALHPNGRYLYAENAPLSGASWVRVFEIQPNSTLTEIQTYFTPWYNLGLSVTPNGRWIYAGGGISSGSNSIPAFDIDPQFGTISPIPGSPFISPGTSPSPKQAVASTDSRFLFVGHGRSAAVRSFIIDDLTGALTDTGSAFTVGIQGDLGNIAVLEDLLLFTRQYGSSTNPAGLFSARINHDGTFTIIGLGDTGASRPFDIAAWTPPVVTCYANCDSSTVEPILNVDDFVCFVNEFAAAQSLPPEQQIAHYANCDGSTTAPVLNIDDFTCFINAFAEGCP